MVKKDKRGKLRKNLVYLSVIVAFLLVILILSSAYLINNKTDKTEEKDKEMIPESILDYSGYNESLNSKPDNNVLQLQPKKVIKLTGSGYSGGSGGSSGGGSSTSSFGSSGPVCGNGILEEGEECDDGNEDNWDDCDNQCRIRSSGGDCIEIKGVGSPDKECIDFGFDFGVAKWECNCVYDGLSIQCGGCCVDKWIESNTIYPGTNVTGTCSLAYWDVGTSPANGIVVKGGNICSGGYHYAINGTNGTVNETKDISHITFCGYNITEYCGDGIISGDEECDDGNNDNGDGCSAECEIEEFCTDIVYDSGSLCMDTGFNSSSGASDYVLSGYHYSTGSNCGAEGFYYVDSLSSVILQTPSLPISGEYVFSFMYRIGGSNDPYNEDFSVECGGNTYTFPDIIFSPEEWREKSILCDFNSGENQVTFTSLSTGSVHLEDFRIYNCEGYCGNNITEQGEECDDGNDDNDDECRNDCTLPYCGDSILDLLEQCELPETYDNEFCSQITQECSGNKLGVRDEFGFCDVSCGCIPDDFVYECVKDKCGAQCGDNGDCDDNSCEVLYEDYCEDKKLADYNANSIFDSELIEDSCENTCDLEDSCSCSDCSVNCEAEPVLHCVKGECEAECAVNNDCDDGDEDTIDTCLESCVCDHEYIPRCGNGKSDEGEECDDGNNENGDGCNAFCMDEYCGDEIINNIDEECEKSDDCPEKCTQKSHKLYPLIGCDDCACEYDSYRCVVGKCGAECDEDEDCSCANDYCDGTTLVDYPEYGVCGTAEEEGCLCQIDIGEGGDCEPILIEYAPECYDPYCGNGIKDEGEECDDGNENNDDECTNDCTLTFCGDLIIQFPNGYKEYEECEEDIDCDDQDEHTIDTCNNCICEHEELPYCGDGIVQGDEECEPPNTDVCDENCKWKIECREDLDCGEDGWLEDVFCICTTNVWDWWITYECVNPGTPESYCTSSSEMELREECGSDSCDDWENVCYNNDVYKERDCYDKGCKSGECFNNEYTNREKIQECYSDYCESYWGYYCKEDDVYRNRTCYDRGCEDAECYVDPYEQEELYENCADTCVNGGCYDIKCFNDEDCPADGWMDMEFCWCGKLFDYWIDNYCVDCGSVNSYCDSSVQLMAKDECSEVLATLSGC